MLNTWNLKESQLKRKVLDRVYKYVELKKKKKKRETVYYDLIFQLKRKTRNLGSETQLH